jgi:multiple sugar transport system ATP-binding protein
MSDGIVIEQVTKTFRGGVRAVDSADLVVHPGEFMVLVGPSGCGKTTLLRMIAGLEEVTSGRILLGDRDVTNVDPRERDIAMVFQNYALYPHMTVQQNLGYSLRVRRVAKDETRRRVNDVARLLGLEDLLDRRPAALSGGQRQRVAMGRAIIREPRAFLMDEPLSNLDAKLRVGMRSELTRLHERLRATTVYVTHDQVEAMTLGHRVAVLKDGRIQQAGTPQELYKRPANVFVASFIGAPSMNLSHGSVSGGTLAFGNYEVPLPNDVAMTETDDVIVGIRPEHFEDAEFSEAGLPRFPVKVEVFEELGSDAHILFAPASAKSVLGSIGRNLKAGDDDLFLIHDEHVLWNARVDPRTRARQGSTTVLTVDPNKIYLFSSRTGENLAAKATRAAR